MTLNEHHNFTGNETQLLSSARLFKAKGLKEFSSQIPGKEGKERERGGGASKQYFKNFKRTHKRVVIFLEQCYA